MLSIYNTLTDKKEVFKPILSGKVGLYVCGVTVYDYCHLGHARTYLAMDMVVRYLRFLGYEINYVRNITDIDDKIIHRANTSNRSVESVVEYYIQAMQEDFSALGLLHPTHEPRATEYIPNMIALIEQMLLNEDAYVTETGDVYFSVERDQRYGCLSHHVVKTMEQRSRIALVGQKHDSQDFALWKAAKPGEPFWPSPWGNGRPGWHIECSAMSMHLLGERFDLHGGGRDLIFPHHENERAQSEAMTKQSVVNIWMHTGYLEINAVKMSKSLNNFLRVRDVLKQYSMETIRYFILSSHYRSPLSYSEHALEQAHAALTRLYVALRDLPDADPIKNSLFEEKFFTAMNDDFNTPQALAVLFELSHEIQRLREQQALHLAAQHGRLLRHFGSIFYILQTDPNIFLQCSITVVDVEQVAVLIDARDLARKNQDWKTADAIRKELAAQSILIEDGVDGKTTWRSMR